jgi:hypothetical protein
MQIIQLNLVYLEMKIVQSLDYYARMHQKVI